MVDTKKEQERDELRRAIWAIADELRGAVDGWDFKNYVLGTRRKDFLSFRANFSVMSVPMLRMMKT